jgi:glycosyltransferase involved in cell wall biosynthesis
MINNVVILLSTYNGEKFLEEQINSLLNQNFNDFKILIRDDGSTDSTIKIIESFSSNFPERISIISNDAGNIGVFESFKKLVESSFSEYYLFCDQDDVWDSNKVQLLVNEIKITENNQNGNCPVMVCGNYRIIDENNSILSKSAYKTYKLSQKELFNGLFQGFIPGCTIIFNNIAKQEFLKYSNLGLHDKQLWIICYLFGIIHMSHHPLMSYRIHTGNTVGLRKKTPNIILIKDLFKYFSKSKSYRNLILQEYFEMQKQLSHQVSTDLLEKKEVYTEEKLISLGFLSRKKWYLKHFKPFHMSKLEGLIQTILF